MVSDQRWMATEAILRRGSQLLVVAGHRVSRRRRLARTVDGWGRINGRRECGARDMPYLTSTLTSTRTHSDGCRRTAPRTEPGNFPTWRTRMHAGGRRESHPVCATRGKALHFGAAFCRLEFGICVVVGLPAGDDPLSISWCCLSSLSRQERDAGGEQTEHGGRHHEPERIDQ